MIFIIQINKISGENDRVVEALKSKKDFSTFAFIVPVNKFRSTVSIKLHNLGICAIIIQVRRMTHKICCHV